MNTLYDLTKRIDTLTYNSQQVLNALIRSCVASGSSSGYRVKKFGQEIELTREDIYCLYSFYEEWKAAGFPGDSTTFYKLLGEADRRFSATGTPVTDAVAKHGRILYMSSTNTGEQDSAWVERIRESASPAATVSTAPIPINLRSPLYDENLSTKSFSQYETYLFPMGYHRNELLGTPGNGEDYVAGGRNWMFDVSDTLMLTGRHIVAGAVSNPANRVANYRDSNTTLSWGTESYALADDALAAGRRSIANADVSISTGERSVAYARWSDALGGKGVRTLGDGSLATNVETTAGGERSTAGNFGSVTGGWPYAFTFETVTSDAQVSTECEAYVTAEGTCMASSTVSMLQDSASKDVLVVSASEVARARLSSFDVKIGDMVCIYDLSYVKDGVTVDCTDDVGYTNRLFSARVTAVSNNPGGGYRITLDSPVPSEYSGAGSLAGGKIATYMRGGVSLGQDSVALNHYTVAPGERQTVVGSSNVPSLDARFVVGVGSSYIEAEGRRANGLLIGEDYGYMKLADGKAMVGVSGDDGSSGDSENVNLFKGAFMQAGSALDGEGITRLNVQPTCALMSSYIVSSGSPTMYADFGIANSLNSLSSAGSVTSLLRSYVGASIVASGNIDGNNLVDYMLSQSDFIRPVPSMNADNSVGIYAEKNIEIRSIGKVEYPEDTGINIQTESGLHQTFRKLYLSGDTYGALTATDNGTSFVMNNSESDDKPLHNMENAQASGQSGFFAFDVNRRSSEHTTLAGPTDGTWQWNWPVTAKAHVFNSTVKATDGTDEYDTAVIAVPNPIGDASVHYRPIVSVGRYSAVGGELTSVTNKELAYFADIPRISCGIAARGGFIVNAADSSDIGNVYTVTGIASKNLCMPALMATNDEWSTGIWAVPTFINGVLTRQIVLRKGNAIDGAQLGILDYIKYSLNGQQLSLQFNCKIDNDPGSNITGIGVPLALGCAVEPMSTIGGLQNNRALGRDSAHVMYYTTFTGTVQLINTVMPLSDFHTEMESKANVMAVALSDGTIMVYFTATGNSFAAGGRYRITLNGTVPFIAAEACCGNSNSDEWQAAMTESTVDRFSKCDWTSNTQGSSALTYDGFLYKLLRAADSLDVIV